MIGPIRALIVDDSEDDAALLLRELRRAGYHPSWTRVCTEPALAAALDREPWDLVLCDYSMPGFGALAAARVVRDKGLDLPFILVSGTIGEESAVECMRGGVHDFVLKDRLARLVPAIERERAEAERRAEQRRTREKLRVAEEALSRTERLRALGQMAAGISHDLKNLLNPLSLHLQLVDRAMAAGDYDLVRSSIAELHTVVRRGVETVERLRQFSRQSPTRKVEQVDLNRIVAEAVAIAKPRISAAATRIPVIREELGAPPPVAGDGSDLLAAVVNLVVNAIDAMIDGGTVVVRTSAADGGAVIEVADDGPGMDADVKAHAFDPFFTTKGDKGTGLGLAMVFASVLRHHGSVSLDSEPGEGARFRIWLPDPTSGARAPA